MSKISVAFNLPERTIDSIKEYCSANDIKVSTFVDDTLLEYASDRIKLANAVVRQVVSGAPKNGGNVLRFGQRVTPEKVQSMRDLSHDINLPFDGLTRIVFNDKLAAWNEGVR